MSIVNAGRCASRTLCWDGWPRNAAMASCGARESFAIGELGQVLRPRGRKILADERTAAWRC